MRKSKFYSFQTLVFLCAVMAPCFAENSPNHWCLIRSKKQIPLKVSFRKERRGIYFFDIKDGPIIPGISSTPLSGILFIPTGMGPRVVLEYNKRAGATAAKIDLLQEDQISFEVLEFALSEDENEEEKVKYRLKMAPTKKVPSPLLEELYQALNENLLSR